VAANPSDQKGKENVVEDSKWELAIVETVYGFYQKLLRDCVQEPVPLPGNLHLMSLGELDQQFPDPLARLRGWLKVFDLAVIPSMLRQTLTPEVDPEIAETLLRYYTRKKASTDVDRDKADFVATFLYRYPRVPGQWEKHGYSLDGVVPIPPFEIALIEILADSEQQPLSEEYVPLLREFDVLRQELESYTTLEALTDSGIVQKGRDLKQALGPCFYHPGVLATIGPYNAAVGKKLEGLFRAATTQLKSFAESVRQEGGDVTSPVEGKVTVQHLAQIEEGEILNAEYATAQEKFRRVSKVKRAVDLRKSESKRSAAPAPAAETEPAEAKPESMPTSTGPASVKVPEPSKKPAADQQESWDPPPVPPRVVFPAAPESPRFVEPPPPKTLPRSLPVRPILGQAAAPQPAKLYDAQVEESKLRGVEDSIRVFVRAADPKFRQVVPMRFFNLTLTPFEADACAADYWDEKSFRGEYARALSRVAALVARTSTELEELKQRQTSSHLWKPHASSLKFLLDASTAVFDQANSVLALAGQRGLNDKVNAMSASLQKLRGRMDQTERLLAEVASKSQS
jgi:hypothetical protein